MTAITLDKETSNYWEIIKDASSKTKLTLLTLISASMVDDEVVTTKQKPLRARRFNKMTDEELAREMQGEPVPIMIDSETCPADIVEANRGKIVKGLEKWL